MKPTDETPEWIKLIDSIINDKNIETSDKLSISGIAIERMKKLPKTNDDIIRFPNVFHKICSSLQISKKDAWELLFQLQKEGYIQIVPYQGIKITNQK